MSLVAESFPNSGGVGTLLKPHLQWGKALKEFQLCDSGRLRKKAQDVQDDVIKLFNLFHARFWGWKRCIEFGLPRRSSPVVGACAASLEF